MVEGRGNQRWGRGCEGWFPCLASRNRYAGGSSAPPTPPTPYVIAPRRPNETSFPHPPLPLPSIRSNFYTSNRVREPSSRPHSPNEFSSVEYFLRSRCLLVDRRREDTWTDILGYSVNCSVSCRCNSGERNTSVRNTNARTGDENWYAAGNGLKRTPH